MRVLLREVPSRSSLGPLEGKQPCPWSAQLPCAAHCWEAVQVNAPGAKCLLPARRALGSVQTRAWTALACACCRHSQGQCF
eukprot:12280455-Alexandrium_andersonii.AAC.1